MTDNSCKHGMPLSFGCDDCAIEYWVDQAEILTQERDSARNALNFTLKAYRPEGAPAVPEAQALPSAIKAAPSDHAGAAPSLETGPAQASGFADCCLPPPDSIAANLMVHAYLNKHTARECEQIVRQLLAARWRPPVATSDMTTPCFAKSAECVHEPNFPSGK